MGFVGAKIIRIIPDQQGRGGSKTSLTTQSINLDIRLASNVFVKYGRWQQATRAIAAADADTVPDVFHSYSLHNFARFDTANANLPPIDRLLSHNQMNTADQRIYQHSPFTIVKTYTPPPGVVDTVAATFLNIKNRCFICWAATNNFIYTGTVTYDVGIDEPQTIATYVLGGFLQYYVFVTAGGTRVTLINVADPLPTDITSVTIDGVNYPTQQPNPIDTGPFAAPGTATGTNGTFTVTINATWPVRDYNGLTLTVDGFPYIIKGYTFPSAGVTEVTLNSSLSTGPSGSAYTITGRQIILAQSYTGETTTTITDTGFPGVLLSSTIATAYNGPLSWTTSPPQYAYAYYDYPGMVEPGLASGAIGSHTITITGAMWGVLRYYGTTIRIGSDSYTVQVYVAAGGTTTVTTVEPLTATYTNQAYELSGTMAEYGTGHISDISPVTFVTEQNQTGVSVVLSNIMPSGAVDQQRFNKIQIFRSIITGGGGIWFPFDPAVGMLDNLGSAPLTFTDTFDDSYLLQNSGLQAPRVSNRKPPPFAHQAFWDGRVWGNPVRDPSAIVFSGDAVQILFGVAEESYPSENILRIPSDDGRVTGMTLMGPLIIITTERYAYFVSGSGQGSDPYRLVRFSTLMYGVGDKQMIEFAGATTDDSDLLLYVGKDKKFYLTAPSVGNITVSDPVQDFFTNGIGQLYDRVRLANVAIAGNHYLVVSIFGTYPAMIYDWDRKVWYNHQPQLPDLGSPQPQAFCTVFGSAVPVRFLYIVNGAVYEWLGESNTVGVTNPSNAFVETMPLSGDRKSKHRLNFVRFYVSDAAETWKALITIDEKTSYLVDLTEYPDPIKTIQPPGSVPIDAINAREIVYYTASGPTNQTEGYRFQVRAVYPDSTTVRELYAIDLCLTDLEPPDQVSE